MTEPMTHEQPSATSGPDAPRDGTDGWAAPPPQVGAPRRFERRAQERGKRADTATRVWGLIVLAVGLWFFADFTLGLDMPAVAWRDIWPLGLIVLGLAILTRGMATRRPR